MPFKVISPVTAEDAPGLGRNNISAYYEETWWRMLFPSLSLEDRIQRTAGRFSHRLHQNREHMRHQVVKDTDTGEIVGYARWILPPSVSSEWLEAQVPQESEENLKKYRDLYESIDFTSERPELDALDDWIHEQRVLLTPPEPHIKLDYVATGPSSQGKGVATMLVQSGIEQANRLGMKIFLVAMGQPARGMYLKNGFKLLSEKSQDLNPYGEDDVYETSMMMKYPETA